MGKYKELAEQIGNLVDQKNAACYVCFVKLQ